MTHTTTCSACKGEGYLARPWWTGLIWRLMYGLSVAYHVPPNTFCGRCEGLGKVCALCAGSECECHCDASEVEA